MGNGMYWWSKYEGKRANGERGRRPKGRGPGPGWTPVMPLEAKDGFFANYKWYLALSTGSLLFSLFVLLAVGETFFLLGGGAPFYFFLALAGIVMGIALPPFWYARHRRMRSIIDASEDELNSVVDEQESRRGFVRRNMSMLIASGIIGAAAWGVIGWIVADAVTNADPLGPLTMGTFGLGYSVILLAAAIGSIALPLYRWRMERRLDGISTDVDSPAFDAGEVGLTGFGDDSVELSGFGEREVETSPAEAAAEQSVHL